MDVLLREQGVYRFGRYRLDAVRRTLLCDGERIKLAERLFDVLLYLVVNHGRVVERDELLQSVWAGRIVEDSNVSQAIFALRKILRATGGQDASIVTVQGRGFRFAEPVVFEPEQPEGWEAPAAAAPDRSPWRGWMPLALAVVVVALAGAGMALRSSRAPGPGAAPAASAFAPPAHSVAVLAFDTLGGDAGQTYLSDGLSEQLIDELTQINALSVAARTSSFSFRGSHATIADIARALNVGAVLAGSVRRSGTRLVVTAQLTNARTGFNIWSKTYDRDQSDIVTVQTDIALAVARSLQVALPSDAATRLALGGTSNAAALDAYLRGMTLRRAVRVEADLRATLAEFDRAVALDPDFALAHARRAFILVGLASTGTYGSADQHLLAQQALAAADRAVALAPMLGMVHSARGAVLSYGMLDHAAAAAEQEKAQALTPGNAAIEGNVASAELALGHLEPAVEAARRATELDPLSPDMWGELARVFYEGHRYGEAMDALDRERTVTGTLPRRHSVLRATVLLLQGHAAEARPICASGGDWQENELLAMADHALGQQAAAEADLARVRAALGDGGALNYAEIAAQWGRTADALRWFDTAVRLRDPGLIDVVLDPLLDPIRSEPKFREILARLAPPGP